MGCTCASHVYNDDIELQKIYNSRYNNIIELFNKHDGIIIALENDNKYEIKKIMHNTIKYYSITVKKKDYLLSVHGFKKLIKSIFMNILNITPIIIKDSEDMQMITTLEEESFIRNYLTRRSVDDYFKDTKNQIIITKHD